MKSYDGFLKNQVRAIQYRDVLRRLRLVTFCSVNHSADFLLDIALYGASCARS